MNIFYMHLYYIATNIAIVRLFCILHIVHFLDTFFNIFNLVFVFFYHTSMALTFYAYAQISWHQWRYTEYGIHTASLSHEQQPNSTQQKSMIARTRKRMLGILNRFLCRPCGTHPRTQATCLVLFSTNCQIPQEHVPWVWSQRCLWENVHNFVNRIDELYDLLEIFYQHFYHKLLKENVYVRSRVTIKNPDRIWGSICRSCWT